MVVKKLKKGLQHPNESRDAAAGDKRSVKKQDEGTNIEKGNN